MKRRTMLQLGVVSSLAKSLAPASDRVVVGIIGVRGRGRALAGNFASLPDVEIACLCDVDERVYDRCAKVIEDAGRPRPPLTGDLRRVLDNKSIDAVVVATPDHWHGPASILACDAGKDVYVEKPASHNVREGRWMIEAARRNRRVVQVGIQSRSRPSTVRAVELVRSGRIGKTLMAKAWDVQLRDNIGHKNDSPVPAGVDFETWTGPAAALPFNENRFHYTWHWHWNYGTGDAGNDGVHQLDIARWALGVDLPQEVSGFGRKIFFDDDQQTPDTMNIAFNYKDKALLWEMRIWNPYGMEGQENGVAVYGTDGVMHIGRWNRAWGHKIYDKAGKLVEEQGADPDADASHPRNFVDCVKSRKTPNGDIEIGHVSTTLCHLANIVAKTGRALKYDPATETIAGDAEAGKLLGRAYRRHWAAPKHAASL